MTSPPSSITEDLLRAAVTPLDGHVDADLLTRTVEHEAACRTRAPHLTRLVTRLVGAGHVLAYEWREIDGAGNVVRKAASVAVRRDEGSPHVRDFGIDT